MPVPALAAFVATAVAVERGSRLVVFDHRLASWLSVHRSPHLQRAALLVVRLAEPTRAAVMLLLLGVALSAVRRSWYPIRTAATTVCLCVPAVLLAKYAFGRVGPMGSGASAGPVRLGPPDLMDAVDRGAFPSGHTTATVVFCSVAVVLVRGRLGRAGAALVAAAGLVVGSALIYAGFHWFSDVLGAYSFSVVIAWAVLRMCPPGASRTNRTNRDIAEVSELAPVTTRSRACA